MNLFFRSFGDAQNPPLLILHGLLGCSDQWCPFGKRFADLGFYVVIPDVRNHGRSFHDPKMDYAILSQDVFSLMSSLGMDSASVIGHSMGGKLAMQMALLCPQRVSRLLVLDITPKSYEKAQQHFLSYLDAMLSIQLSEFQSRVAIDDALMKTVDDAAYRQFLLKNLHRDKESYVWRPDLISIKQNLSNLSAELDLKARYEGPTLFLKGGLSDYIHEDDAPMLKRIFPNSELAIIEGSGHWIQVDQPEAFYAAAAEFLKP